MAEASHLIFNKKAAEKLRSPDDLEKYVQVTNPSIWLVLFACVALLVGLLAWGIFGAVETKVATTGAVVELSAGEEAKPVCFLTASEVTEVNAGDKAVVGGKEMTVAEVKSIPMSAGEVNQLLPSDYLVSALLSGDWAYAVTFEGDASELAKNVPLAVNITVERVAPISLIFKG